MRFKINNKEYLSAFRPKNDLHKLTIIIKKLNHAK